MGVDGFVSSERDDARRRSIWVRQAVQVHVADFASTPDLGIAEGRVFQAEARHGGQEMQEGNPWTTSTCVHVEGESAGILLGSFPINESNGRAAFIPGEQTVKPE
jgi:hypothetical protein